MHQLLGLRSFSKDGKTIKYDAFHEQGWRAKSLEDLFENLEVHLSKIPAEDRWNMFYTVASCRDGKREFRELNHLVFDLDGIDNARHEDYANITLAALGVRKEDTGLVASGNGLHIIIGLKEALTSAKAIEDLKPQYGALCAKINQALANAGLPGKADSVVFEARRILRLPGTINRKPNKPEVMARLLQGKITRINYDLVKASGLPRVTATDQLPKSFLKRYPSVDSGAVLAGCAFLKHAKEHPNKIAEPAWYAALSIVGRFDDKGAAAHELSKGHKAYTPEETNDKLRQAVENSGPRTCSSINDLWGNCHECPNFQKVKSPILLRSGDYIRTEATGFHVVTWKADGNMGKPLPAFDDLRRFFERVHPYVCLGDSRIVMVWTGTHYTPMGNATMESFAQEHFNPEATSAMRREFRELVSCTNIKPIEWFEKTTEGHTNFLNGTLNNETNDFRPHDNARGFRYVLPYNYDPEATCPVFDKTMVKISQGNQDLEAVLDEFAGYSVLSTDYRFDKALVLVGEGANGKTTWINALRSVAGEGNYSSLTMLDLQDSEYNRYLIEGKLFNVSEETQIRALVDSSMFKRLVGGGIIQVRKPYKDPYEVKNRAKIIITCNTLPYSSDPTFGFHRRLTIAPFNAVFTSKDSDFDPHIDAKIAKELPGIFNRFHRAYSNLTKRDKFFTCDVITKAVDAYIYETDSVKSWAKDNIRVSDYEQEGCKFTNTGVAYEIYRNEMISSSEKPVTKAIFVRRLKKIIPDYERRNKVKKINGELVRGLEGVDVARGVGIDESLIETMN